MKEEAEIKRRVLVVDDESEIREEICEYLSAQGFTTLSGEDGIQALELFETTTFDAIVTDVKMPKCDGHVFIRAVRNQNSVIPIIALTGHYATDELNKLKMAGASKTLLKPTRLRTLRETLEELLG